MGKKLLFVFNPKSGKGLIKNYLIDIIDTMVKADYEVTASPMTMAGLSCEVTASAEQIPSTCTRMGWLRLRGLANTSLFSFENSLLIVL